MTAPELHSVSVAGSDLTTATWGSGPVGIVLLHDGLGSIRQWRSVPEAINRVTGVAVLAYERAGHGASTPVPAGAWPTDWLHREADVFAQLLHVMQIDEPVVVGHSDGGSIGLIHAAAGGSCRGVLAVAAHSWVETRCTDAINQMREYTDRIVAGLRLHHSAPAELFEAWSAAWVSDAFASWDIRPLLGDIAVPATVVQGDRDEYATDAQLTETAAAIGEHARVVRLEDAGHIIHHEQPDVVTGLVAEFYDQVCRGAAEGRTVSRHDQGD